MYLDWKFFGLRFEHGATAGEENEALQAPLEKARSVEEECPFKFALVLNLDLRRRERRERKWW